MKKTLHIASLSLSLCAAAALVACGGGDDSVPAAAAAAAVSVPAVTIALPAAPGGTPVTAADPGVLPTLGFVSALTNSQVDATITGSGATSVMTFLAPSFAVTGADSATPTWSANGGMVRAGGNVLLYCAAGKQAVVDPISANNVPFQQGGNVFISANLVPVSDASVLAGLTMKMEDCAGDTSQTTYKADGSSTRVDAVATTQLSVAQTAAFFSAGGFTGGGGSNYKVRVYKYTSGGTARYFLVSLVNQVSPNATFVTVGYQVP